MKTNIAWTVLAVAGAALAQYNDYPTGEYEFAHNRLVVSPIKMVGGMDPAKRDEGPKVNLAWTPNIDIVEARYEYIYGVDGTLGFGPKFVYYPGLDSVKASAFAGGVYGRYYLNLARGPYVQLALEWYSQSGAKVRNGTALDTAGKSLANATVNVSGPQASPVLGYCQVIGQHLVLEGQMGFTIGRYTLDLPNGSVIAPGRYSPQTYKNGSDWGGFYFAQLALGVAW